MIPVNLTSIKTRDGVVLDGIVVEPHKKSGTALIWIHGLTSRFSSGQALIKELSSRCQRNRIGYFKFNNRGHDIINKDGERNKKLLGGGLEKFEDCIHDIRAIIRYTKLLGYGEIILAGHSTGANKALYYLSTTRDRSVRGLMLLGPVSDIPLWQKTFGEKQLVLGVRIARGLKKNTLMPLSYGILSATRFLSMITPGSTEDTFPYHNPAASWRTLKSICVPIAVIFGGRDEYLDRPAKEIIEIFRRHAASTKSFTGVMIKGANHGFVKKEAELSRIIIKWIKQNGL